MEKENIKLIPKKRRKTPLKKMASIFEDQKKRYIFLLLIIFPLLIAIGVFGSITYKEIKNLISLATNNSTDVKVEYSIPTMNYSLRDNATDYQKELFAELKDSIETTPTTDDVISGYICKNFIADFYTWTNKQGQYDVGGMQYLYTGKQEGVSNIKTSSYTKARDTFYKYLNNYIKEYGAENLLEVENIDVVSSNKGPHPYQLRELIRVDGNDTIGWTPVYEEIDYDVYLVTCVWTYKENEVFSPSRYAKKANFGVIFRDGRYEIVEVSEGTIDVGYIEKEEISEEE